MDRFMANGKNMAIGTFYILQPVTIFPQIPGLRFGYPSIKFGYEINLNDLSGTWTHNWLTGWAKWLSVPLQTKSKHKT